MHPLTSLGFTAGLMASSDASQLAGAPAPQEDPPASAGSAHTTGAATQRPAGSGSAGPADATGDGTHLPAGSASAGSGKAGPEPAQEGDSGECGEPARGGQCFYAVGTGRSVPGATKETNAALIMEILNDEANGQHWIPPVGRADGGWCRKQFLKSVSGAGEESWKSFKTTYKLRIDYSPDWQWVRVDQGQKIDPFGAAKQD